MSTKGLLLANLGTPESPDRRSVGRFLSEFLADPRVVDLPRWLWLPLLRLVIVPLRAGRSAKAYREIWTEAGSPLLILTMKLATAMQAQLGQTWRVETGMRYGKPSIASGLAALRQEGIEDVVVLPLYPQYSRTTTASVRDAVESALADMSWRPRLTFIDEYHLHPAWVAAVADSIRAFGAENGQPEKVLFSLHGIPERYVESGDPYRDQCRASVEAVAAQAGLDGGQWQLTFQSRVGREPWLQPYTDETLCEAGEAGVEYLQVVCPGFAVDCLETLEEIAMEGRSSFLDAGGQRFDYIPCLNDSPSHAAALAAVVAASPDISATAGAEVPEDTSPANPY